MPHSTERIEVDFDDPLREANAIKQCLEYLQGEAANAGMKFAAHLIGVAAEAINDSIEFARQVQSEAPGGADRPDITYPRRIGRG